MKEFNCSECSSHIIDIAGTNTSGLCATCTSLPGWFKDPVMRKMLDPMHDGIEAMDREKIQ